ncbi:bifunctional hydroxymethylpyrimidine kinase/phosphomethylpyrimidine kinase [Geomesophilobacter sediminis]|uniref:Thiamine-phosphate synthase n=1 Tax=Geomesophilobacter sediminis TaxID=2798584 RepID=A0A8J7M2A7_9BACT|nr:bifunctional hydroxymethylpyrimidine kinase/phosphomethylpyrimidine kinase [Geomesophilobacter sediminis]MBJ6727008.1 bifunctional hydroxymethylpyrimidine kinase/phosphomethylpyrimidine kinase [Geomesophilobacter sediminis]
MSLHRKSVISGLYLITDDGEHLLERVEAALHGGVRVLQYRDKHRSHADRFALGSALKELCARFDVPFIVNDDLELARELDADGVHLGQDDGDPVRARQLLGPNKVIGISTHNPEEAATAEAAGADYLGFGAIYPTASKEVGIIQGPEAVRAIKERVKIPVVAIGGIDRDNAPALIDNGIDAVAVISAVLAAGEPELAAREIALLFNRALPQPRGAVLTVAGSDSGGGAGIQGDLKTITLLGSYGASAIAALTAQNSTGVTGIHPVPAEFLRDQLDAVLSDLPIDVVKVGMLLSPENAAVLADRLRTYRKQMLVLDTVMVAKGGAHLLDDEAVQVLKKELIPLSYLLTPNVPEAERLTGLSITSVEAMVAATRELHRMGARNVLLKGGHLEGDEVADLFFDGSRFAIFTAPRTPTPHTHGTGCALASAIATFLAQGEPLPAAISRGKQYITRAIQFAGPFGKGHGSVNHYRAATP